MLKPNYTLTDKILNNISEVGRFYGRLEGLRIPKKLWLNLERQNLIQSSYVSNSIEGNPLSFPEVTNLLLDDRVPANKNEKEVKNYFELLKSLPNYKDRPFSLVLTKEIHKRLLSGVNDAIAGRVRNSKVVVGRSRQGEGESGLFVKHEPPHHARAEIENTLRELFSWLERKEDIPIIIQSGVFHHHFVFIHPFSDGNGRVCRLLTALVFIKNGYRINKYFVLDDYYDIDRRLYSDKLHSADSGDKTEWLEYFSDGVKYSLQSSLGRIKSAVSGLKIEGQPTPREEKVLKILQEREEITSSDLAERLEISRQQAYNLLNSLLEKGFVGKKGKTKASYYFLK